MNSYKNIACVAPFSSLFIHSSKKIFPCCAYDQSKSLAINEDEDIISNFNKVNEPIRQEFLSKGTDISSYTNCRSCNSGPSGQNICHNIEANPDIDYIANPTLTNLHVKFSNQCNLACRICESGCSNQLYKEDVMLKQINARRNVYPVLESSINVNSTLISSIKDNLYNINTLYFSGGEPLLQEPVWEVLKEAALQGYSKNIRLKFNTNGTIKLNQEKYAILKSFNNLEMYVSMDGIKNHSEYVRTNLSWDRFIDNLTEYKNEFQSYPNFLLGVVSTVSVYNVHIIDKILNFFSDFGLPASLNYVFDPRELCVFNLRQDIKDYLIDKYTSLQFKTKHYFYYNELINFIKNENVIDPDTISTFIDNKDNTVLENNLYKNYQPFRDVEPEWYAMLKG